MIAWLVNQMWLITSSWWLLGSTPWPHILRLTNANAIVCVIYRDLAIRKRLDSCREGNGGEDYYCITSDQGLIPAFMGYSACFAERSWSMVYEFRICVLSYEMRRFGVGPGADH